VRGLESEFSIPLVNVRGQHVTLTKQGELLVELARPVVQGFDSIREQFGEQLLACALHLTVAAPNDILVNDLPEPIREYRKAFPPTIAPR
jgi:DNA-binding transcriptional LysR family regulator